MVSNNGDSEKILATVVSAVFAFLDQSPSAWIFASGSTSARTRLYQMGISRYLEYISEDWDIYGQIGDYWYPFERNNDYQAFLAKMKTT